MKWGSESTKLKFFRIIHKKSEKTMVLSNINRNFATNKSNQN